MYEVYTCSEYLKLSNEHNTLISAQLLEGNNKFQLIFMNTYVTWRETSHFAANMHNLKKSIRFWSKMTYDESWLVIMRVAPMKDFEWHLSVIFYAFLFTSPYTIHATLTLAL